MKILKFWVATIFIVCFFYKSYAEDSIVEYYQPINNISLLNEDDDYILFSSFIGQDNILHQYILSSKDSVAKDRQLLPGKIKAQSIYKNIISPLDTGSAVFKIHSNSAGSYAFHLSATENKISTISSTNFLYLNQPDTLFAISFDNNNTIIRPSTTAIKKLCYAYFATTSRFYVVSDAASQTSYNYNPISLYSKIRDKEINSLTEISSDTIYRHYLLPDTLQITLKIGNELWAEDIHNKTPIHLTLSNELMIAGADTLLYRGAYIKNSEFIVRQGDHNIIEGLMLTTGKIAGFQELSTIEPAVTLTASDFGHIRQITGTLTVYGDDIPARISPELMPEIYYNVINPFTTSNTKKRDATWQTGEPWPEVGEYPSRSVAGVIMPAADNATPEVWAVVMSDSGPLTHIDEFLADDKDEKIIIYSLDGTLIKNLKQAKKGIYILKSGNRVKKIIIP